MAEVEPERDGASDQRFRAIINSLPGSFFQYDGNLQLIDWNSTHESITGLTADSAGGHSVFDSVDEQDHDALAQTIADIKEHGRGSVEVTVVHSDGTQRVPYFFSAARYDNETETGFLGIGIDISDIEETRGRLKRETAFLDSVLQSTDSGLIVIGMDESVLFYNERYLEFFGISVEPLTKASAEQRRVLLSERTSDPAAFLELFDRLMLQPTLKVETEIVSASGAISRCYSAPVYDQDDVQIARIWTFEDITARRHAELQLEHFATHDDVTGLLNRSAFFAHMSDRLESARRAQERFGVLLLDLGRFGVVNTTYGHAIGDEVLQEMGQRLQQALADELGEQALIARHGGDEFAALISDASDPAVLVSVAERFIEVASTFDTFRGRRFDLGASIGISVFPDHGTEVSSLINHADLALDRTQSRNRNGYHFFSQHIEHETQRRFAIESHLRDAIALDQLSSFRSPRTRDSSSQLGNGRCTRPAGRQNSGRPCTPTTLQWP